jgi:alpha-beta hydrolase superfamily lysophospholipase
MDNVVFDLHAFVCDTLTKVSPEIKYFIVSKAVGAVFVNHLHARIMADNFARKPAGFVCISPAGRIEKTYSSAHKALAKAISKVAPNVGVAKVKAELMNRDPAEQQKYVNDELVYHGAIRADTASTVLKAMRTSDFTLMRAPVLVLSAALEKVVDADAAPYLYQCLPSTDKLIKVYDHCYHDLVHEPEKLTVINEVRVLQSEA